jgi:hypothetical protein
MTFTILGDIVVSNIAASEAMRDSGQCLATTGTTNRFSPLLMLQRSKR